jgi:hypothetical protein
VSMLIRAAGAELAWETIAAAPKRPTEGSGWGLATPVRVPLETRSWILLDLGNSARTIGPAVVGNLAKTKSHSLGVK